MTARETVLATISRSLAVSGNEAPRRLAVEARLSGHPTGVVPARGDLPPAALGDLFARMLEGASGTVERAAAADIPAAIAAYLRRHNLAPAIRYGADLRLAALPWDRERTLDIRRGPSAGNDMAAVSHAFAAVAETGTLVLVSGADNPTTLNFLPDVHIVVVEAADIAGNYEAVMARLRRHFGAGGLPRTVNLITGPSRSADIEQTLILGAHGPRRLHVIMVGNS